MTGGVDPDTGLCSPTEDFFDDDAFREFLEHYTDGVPTTLVINGDLFDFLQVMETRLTAEMRSLGITQPDVDPVYGLRCTENTTRYLVRRIVRGHPVFFRALVAFAAHGGNQVKITRGNHDVQLFWPSVQQELIECMTALETLEQKGVTAGRMEVLTWFYYVPGLVYIEHGNQYEYTTSFQHFLVPRLPFAYGGTSNHVELDLSGFLVRYLTNRLERVNPLADNVRPLTNYFDWMWRNYPLLFVQTIGTALRFVLMAFSKARAIDRRRSSPEYENIRKENDAAISATADRFHTGSPFTRDRFLEHLQQIDSLKEEPTLQRGAWAFLWRILRRPLQGAVFLGGIQALVFVVIPRLAQALRDHVTLGAVPSWLHWVVRMLWEIRAPQIVIGAAVLVSLIVLRKKLRPAGQQAPESLSGNPVGDLRRRALEIADMLEVRYVTFGHTHYTDIGTAPSGRRYFNTGTWMQIANDQEQLYRDGRQFTFLCIENESAALMQWEPRCARPREVVVMNTDSPDEQDEDGLLRFIMKLFTKK
ncbi:MAG TPA: hypothetical protein VHI13_02770 [Candidatus Kapabacteria bacterium]|nr:hypothetical protein [Candidatus Kapabacteria bacterium]